MPADPLVGECLREASDALNEDVLDLDTPDALRSTRAVQLCLLIAGVACSRLLIAQNCTPDYVAGLSIGAYPAAVIAGALSFADAVRLVALRGELMQSAYPTGYGMTALIGLDQTTVEHLVSQVHSPDTPVYLANINADNQFVIAGRDQAMARVAALAKAQERGGGQTPGGQRAFALRAAERARENPGAGLCAGFGSGADLEVPERQHGPPVFNADKLRDDLAFNMCRVIDWRSTVQTAYERGARLHIELPPGTVLTGWRGASLNKDPQSPSRAPGWIR